MKYRIGNGYDVHAFAEGRKLIIGGIEIPHDKGLAGHSDADVLLHSITDALLGAVALGDMGKHFPDTDKNYKDADSKLLLLEAYKLLKEKGYQLGNLDAVVVIEKPKLSPFIQKIRENIAGILESNIDQISVKATTNEKLGFIGRDEGVAAFVTVSLVSTD